MRGEGHELLEGRSVRPPHGVREDAGGEADPLAGRVGAPGRRRGPLRRLELGGRLVERVPERLTTRREDAGSAVTPRIGAADGTVEQRAQILLDVAVPARDVRGAARVRIVAPPLERVESRDQRT